MISKYFKAIIISLFFILLTQSISAITVEQILDNFKKTYEKSKNFSADFEETTYRDDTKSVAKGRLLFAKPNLLRKEYVAQNNPERIVQLIVIDGKFSWSYVQLLNQVTKLKLKDENQGLIPGVGKSLDKLKDIYDMKIVQDEVAESKDVYHIELLPKSSALSNNVKGKAQSDSGKENELSEKFEVWIRTKDWVPVQFSYKSESEIAGDMTIVISFRKIKINQDLPKSTFVFEPPEDAEVVDISDENWSE